MFQKTAASGRDLYLALLELRNKPLIGLEYCPVQLRMGRLLKTTLPSSHTTTTQNTSEGSPQIKATIGKTEEIL